MAMDIQVARDENRCRHMGYSLQLAARVLLCPLSHRLDSTYHGFFFTPVVEHWLEREIAQWFHHEESIRRPIAPWANAVYTGLQVAPTGRHTEAENRYTDD